MARPPRISPPSYPDPAAVAKYVAGLPTASGEPAPAAGYVPASVTGAWDTLRVSLGQTVPAHVTAAKRSAARMLRTVR